MNLNACLHSSVKKTIGGSLISWAQFLMQDTLQLLS